MVQTIGNTIAGGAKDLAKKGIESNRYMRIAVRNHGDNEKFIEALKELVK